MYKQRLAPSLDLAGRSTGKSGCRAAVHEGLRATCTDSKCRFRDKKEQEPETQGAETDNKKEDTEIGDEDKALDKKSMQNLTFQDALAPATPPWKRSRLFDEEALPPTEKVGAAQGKPPSWAVA